MLSLKAAVRSSKRATRVAHSRPKRRFEDLRSHAGRGEARPEEALQMRQIGAVRRRGVATPESACHAGGRGFESRRSRKSPCKFACCVVCLGALSEPTTHTFPRDESKATKTGNNRFGPPPFQAVSARLTPAAKAACNYTKWPEVTSRRASADAGRRVLRSCPRARVAREHREHLRRRFESDASTEPGGCVSNRRSVFLPCRCFLRRRA
jgi:hypothetical protein